MFEDLVELTDSPVSYVAVLFLVALDAVLPIAPSETLLVTGGVLVEEGSLLFPLMIASAAAGALLGDSVLYALGVRTGPRMRERLFRGERGRDRLERAGRQLHTRTWLLIVSDFLPGGRTAAMFAAGALGLPRRRFYAYIVPGAFIWALFYVLAGMLGAGVFEEGGWAALGASVAVGLVLAAAAEGVHRLVLRRRARR